MVNLRHPDNIFYDHEGDLFIITTDLDGRQEVVCKTNLECVSDVLARLLDINFKKVCDTASLTVVKFTSGCMTPLASGNCAPQAVAMTATM